MKEEKNKEWREENRDHVLQHKKEYRDANKDSIREYNRKWLEANPDYHKNYYIENIENYERHRVENRDKRNAQIKEWASKNRDHMNKYYSERKANNPDFRAAVTVRQMLHRVVRETGCAKEGRAMEILGYTPDVFKSHLERQFTDGMSWDNHGAWHIDHIKPVSAFIREGVTDPAIINALSNLKPLWAEENQRKYTKTQEEWESYIDDQKSVDSANDEDVDSPYTEANTTKESKS